MAKFFISYYIGLILLIFSSGKLFCKVPENLCTEDLGPCDGNCDSGCKSKHPNGVGTCDAATNSCKCVYECTAPEPKICTSAIGRCSSKCNEECCNQNCAAKYPGPLNGHGICQNVIGLTVDNMCMCSFNC
ncbi:hypothetical protein Pint_14063 [Pistacia integerrima]|uniref:Uncharacterized protein n=1 Tax=Pistacia integerrima TaxID=434235 RepID=A0ACC0Y5Y8_9ROSI|nr:hypothetical protein Pint_14063 [Pistacia integerrima]